MKKAVLTIAISLLAFRLLATTKKKNMKPFAPIKPNQKFRNCDPLGCGYFDAPRGSRKHNGVDIITYKGEPIKSPITGTVKRHAYPYANDLKYKGIVIENNSYYIKLFYLEPSLTKGTSVIEGTIIGISQDVAEKHGASMETHIHFEAYKKVNGELELIDPTNLFKVF